MNVIAVFNQKGGVGKTTLSFHLGWSLVERGARVLMIDLDPQGNLSALFEADSCTAQHLFTRPPAEALVPLEILRPAPGGQRAFSLISANEQLQAVEPQSNTMTGPTKLRRALKCAEGKWDAVVIDCPPSLGGFSGNAIVAARHLIVPCTLRQFSIHGLEHVSELVAATKEDGLNPELELLGIVLNQYNRAAKNQTTFERDFSADVAARYEGKVLASTIPSSIKIEEGLFFKLPVWEHAAAVPKDASARGAGEAYRTVTNELLKRLEACHGSSESTLLAG